DPGMTVVRLRLLGRLDDPHDPPLDLNRPDGDLVVLARELARVRGRVGRLPTSVDRRIGEDLGEPRGVAGRGGAQVDQPPVEGHAGVAERRRAAGAHHQLTPPSRSASISSRSRVKVPALRYFQPPSGSSATIVPDVIRWASRAAATSTAPQNGPPKIPSRSTRSRSAAIASALLTRYFASSIDGSRISGTNPSSSERRPWTPSPGSGSAATIRTPGFARRRYRPTPMSGALVPTPATKTTNSGQSAMISGPVVSSCARGLASLPYWYGMT